MLHVRPEPRRSPNRDPHEIRTDRLPALDGGRPCGAAPGVPPAQMIIARSRMRAPVGRAAGGRVRARRAASRRGVRRKTEGVVMPDSRYTVVVNDEEQYSVWEAG